MERKKGYPLSTHELIGVEGVKCRPRINKEYFEEDGVWWRNSFRPSVYMLLEGEAKKEPKTILGLLLHLANYDPERLEYTLNWLAYFFKFLKKSQVALILIGDQGAGKGILFRIISKLIGELYCITINDESLNSKYKAKMISDKLFFNLDEATNNTSKKNHSFCKALITNSSISAEAKNENMEEEIELHGQVLITSNNSVPITIDDSDRRNTVFTTAGNLSKNNYLNYGSFENLEAAIELELEDFARTLKNYDVDIKLANTALDTPEKRVIINASKDHIKDFHSAIINMDIAYFSELEENKLSLYMEIRADFKKGLIDRANITKAYNALFSKNITAKELLSKLRQIKPYETFSLNNMYEPGNYHYFILKEK